MIEIVNLPNDGSPNPDAERAAKLAIQWGYFIAKIDRLSPGYARAVLRMVANECAERLDGGAA